MVERSPEEAGVVSSILTRGTTLSVVIVTLSETPIIVCGYGSMVELFLAKEGIGVRFPLAAPKIL